MSADEIKAEQEKQEPEKASFGDSQLARYGEGSFKHLDKLLKKRASTGPKEMEIKRREIGALTLAIEGLINSLDKDEQGNELDVNSPGYLKKLNTVNLLGSLCTMKELEYICDCLSWRQRVTIKGTGEVGYVRISVADTLTEIASICSNEEDGISETMDMIAQMLNDMGVAQKAFRDKNGIHDSTKYFHPTEPTKEKVAPEVEPEEAMSESEIAEIDNRKPEETVAKIGKKKE